MAENRHKDRLAEFLDKAPIIPGFDCLEMKRIGQEHLQEKLAGMSEEEQLAWWAERTTELRKRQAELRERHGKEA